MENNVVIRPKLPCAHHDPMEKYLETYGEWRDYIDQKYKAGEIQTQCPDCGRYFFAEEMGTKPENHVA